MLAGSLIGLIIFSFANLSFRFKYYWINAILLNTILFFFGCLITELNNHESDVRRLRELSVSGSPIIVSISEPLSEKPKSWKALAAVEGFNTNILVYFKKDSLSGLVKYGDKIAFKKVLRPIENLPVFGTFDYKKYCALKNIHYQIFLTPNEFIVLQEKDIYWFNAFLFTMRDWVVTTIRKYIPGKKESGLAEALLIGYKDDVDKDLMKSYSNTGVIHVVAISGMHLGLIYVLLKHLCYPFRKRNKLMTAIIIVSGLWIFSLLAGGSPSVLRSSVMFTFIVAGECFYRTTSIYNNLAASAFFLLCYNPYWLWDLGFQLSYLALLSIVIFQKPIYYLFISKNKIVDNIWKLNAVTLSAQILTTPACIFYFNQFPNIFLITNFIAVPLSGIILIGEIILCAVAYFPWMAMFTGVCLHYLIYGMNTSVEYCAGLPSAVTQDISMNFPQLMAAYSFILFVSLWLLARDKNFVFPALFILIFLILCNDL